MSEPIVAPANSGQELQLSDVDNLGAVAGLADDRVLAEFLHMTQYDGTVSKAIVTSQNENGFSQCGQQPCVVPSGSGNGSVTINPFRAVIGTRNYASGSPSPNPAGNYQSNALAAYRDIRSGMYVGSSSSVTGTQAFAANSSGNPRWDLVYATVAVDANGPSVTRRIKAPSTGVVTTTSVPAYLSSAVTIGVVAGTPGATPALPTLPADAAGNYNVPLAWVRIPNGFSATSTIATTDIRSATLASDGATPTSRYVALQSSPRIEPANGNNDAGSGAGSSFQTNFPWNASSGGRPGPFLPPDWTGGKMLLVEMDLVTGGSYSHTTGSIVDSSVDWRNRIFPYVAVQACSSSEKFANDATGGINRLPNPAIGLVTPVFQMANSFAADAQLATGGASILYLNNGIYSPIPSATLVGLYVNMTDGTLRALVTGSIGLRLVIFLLATEQFPNL